MTREDEALDTAYYDGQEDMSRMVIELLLQYGHEDAASEIEQFCEAELARKVERYGQA